MLGEGLVFLVSDLPAKAFIQRATSRRSERVWIPACAGKTAGWDGRGLGEGLTSPLSRPDLNLAAQDLRNHSAALSGLFAE